MQRRRQGHPRGSRRREAPTTPACLGYKSLARPWWGTVTGPGDASWVSSVCWLPISHDGRFCLILRNYVRERRHLLCFSTAMGLKQDRRSQPCEYGVAPSPAAGSAQPGKGMTPTLRLLLTRVGLRAPCGSTAPHVRAVETQLGHIEADGGPTFWLAS